MLLKPMSEKVKLEKDGVIATITIQNPPFNELSGDVLLKLGDVLAEVKNDNNIKAVILTGGKVFSIGADVLEIYKLSQLNDKEKILESLNKANGVVNALGNLNKMTVAAINGFCLGGGNELAMACSYRVASENAKFGQPEITLGIIPGMGGTQRLPRLVNTYSAVMLLIEGNQISAEKAKEIGLVNKVIPENILLQTVREFIDTKLQAADPLPSLEDCMEFNHSIAGELFTKDGFWELLKNNDNQKAVLAIIEAVRKGLPKYLSKALEIEQKLFAEIVLTETARQKIEKFLTKFGKIKKEKPAPEPATVVNAAKDDKTEELRMLKEMVSDFAQKEIAPKVGQMEKERRVLPELIKQMAELGFYGVPFDEKYGGSSLGLTGYCVLMEELSRVHGSTAVMVGAHTSLACKSIYLFGSEDQKRRYLVPGIKGEKIGAYATTEPSVGSDVAGIKTSAKKVDGGWMVSGSKQFISNGAIADFVIVFAQTDPEGGNKTQVALIIDTVSKGFQITKETEEKIGLHASCTSAFVMDSVFVPNENLLGEVGQGFKIAMNVFNQSRISLGAGCVGAVKAARDQAIQFAKDRQIGGEPLWMKQITQTALGKIEAVIYTLENLVYNTARLYDSGKTDIRKESAIVKYMTAEEAWKAIDIAVQIHGGSGYIEDYSVARLLRDMRVNRIFEGTSEVQLLLIAKEILKENL